ncbi:MAG: hypothetical protein CMN26_06230 [Salinisphaera sp.]|nr:hypothetical protein [Salinisphaera sp.]
MGKWRLRRGVTKEFTEFRPATSFLPTDFYHVVRTVTKVLTDFMVMALVLLDKVSTVTVRHFVTVCKLPAFAGAGIFSVFDLTFKPGIAVATPREHELATWKVGIELPIDQGPREVLEAVVLFANVKQRL